MVKARLLPLALALSLGIGSMPIVSAMAANQTMPGSSNAAVTGSAVVAEAERFLGYPYSYTGDSPATGFSCIGFVWYVYHELGMNIPGTNPTAVGAYTQVSEADLEPGDLVFFQGTFPGLYPSHVAIYIGGGKLIHAANPSYGVTISSLVNDPRDGDYWQEHYLSAERPWSGPATGGSSPIVVRPHKVLVVVVPSLDLRSGDSNEYTVETVLVDGARLTVEGWAPGWVRVRDADGTVGWVVRSAVRNDVGYQPVSTSRRSALWRGAKTVYVYGLNVHTSPSISAPVTFTLSEGSRVAVVTRSGGWDEIKTAHGAAGWVAGQYLGRHDSTTIHHRVSHPGRKPLRYGVNIRLVPSMAGAVEATSNGLPVHVLRWEPYWVEVRLSNGVVGWVDRAFIGVHRVSRIHRVSVVHSAIGFRGGHAVYPGVNIHSGPGVGYADVGGTFAGMRVKVSGYSGEFAHIRTSTGLHGWIEARFIEGVTRTVASISAARGYHAVATIRLHSSAGINAPVIGAVFLGQHVKILRSVEGWDYVRLKSGARGYVDGSYIAA